MLGIAAGLALLSMAAQAEPSPCGAASKTWVLVAHGGAGAWDLPKEVQARTRVILQEALLAGGRLLARGATAVDAVEAVIVRLEDAPELNAGRGGIPNRAGFVELDAAIMRGEDLNAGAVAAVRTVKNPIKAARAAMERSEHLMFVGAGADDFARQAGLDIVEPSHFLVKPPRSKSKQKSKAGTVGAVALDRCGNLAAGTSTGGYDEKTPGRVGDVPVIGAGTYANRKTAAFSATGWGEYFIRYTAAHDASALMEYRGFSVAKAIRTVLEQKIAPAGATGGFIAVDAEGTWATHHTSPGLLRGVLTHEDGPTVSIFDESR